MELWLRTNETEEAVSALEMIAESSSLIMLDNYRWKWVLIAMHSALQGFMVLALNQSNGLKTLRKDSAIKLSKAWLEGGEYPKAIKLDDFLSLYNKIKNPKQMKCYIQSQSFSAKNNHDESVEKLNELRNDFIHFVPKGWSLGLTGLPEICLDCLGIIEFLGWYSGNVLWHQEEHKNRAETALKKSIENLQLINKEYENQLTKQSSGFIQRPQNGQTL